MATYHSDDDYPGVFATVRSRQTMRGQECGMLCIYPFQYNATDHILYVYPDLTVTVRFVGTATPIPARLKSRAFQKMMRHMAVNSQEVLESAEELELMAVDEVESEGQGLMPVPLGADPTGCDYLIVTHPDYEDAADTLAAWKHKSGYRTKVVNTDTTGDTSGEIDTYIEDGYDDWDIVPKYVLFLGDADDVPTCDGLWHPGCAVADRATCRQGIIGTDWRYATVGTFDETPELITGRLSVGSLDQANDIVDRIIDYEKNPTTDTSYYETVALAAAFQDGSEADDGSEIAPDHYADRRFAKTAEDVLTYLLTENYSVVRIYNTLNDANNAPVDPCFWSRSFKFENDGAGGLPIPDSLRRGNFAWDGSATHIDTAVESGVFLLMHRDHGGRGGWGTPEFDRDDVDDISNGDKRPVVWSINCQTGWFDNETDLAQCGSTSDCFAESWIRHDTGGSVGVIAATRISWSGINDRLAWGLMDAIWPDFIEDTTKDTGKDTTYGSADPIYRMGDVLNTAKAYMQTKYSCSVVWWNQAFATLQLYHWFGDPTMEIVTAKPGTLSITKPGYSAEHKYLDVTVKNIGGTALKNARVTLYKEDKGWYSDLTDSSGKVRLYFDAAVTATFDLTVTCHNYKPYEGTVYINYTDTTNPNAPQVHSTEGQSVSSAPTVVDIDFSDDNNLDWVAYRTDDTGAWRYVQSGIAGASYTANWPYSSIAFSALSQGSHYVYFQVVDDAGNETNTSNHTAAFHFKKDTAGPALVGSLDSSSHSVSAFSKDNTIDVSWTAAVDTVSGLHGYSCEWSNSSSTVPNETEDIDKNVTSRTSGALADGTWYFQIAAADSVENFGTGVWNPNWGSTAHLGPFYIDTVDPTSPIYRTSEGEWYCAEPELNIDFSDNKDLHNASWKKKNGLGWNTIFASHDGTSYTANWTMASTPWDALAEGTNYIYFKIMDDAGNDHETANDIAAFSFIKDVTAPTITYNTSPGQWFKAAAPTLDIDFADKMGAANGQLERIEYTVESGSSITLGSNINAPSSTNNWTVDSTEWANCADGTELYIYFVITDEAGNSSTPAFWFKKDALPPVANAAFTNTGIVLVGDTVNFTGSGSTDGNGIDKYEWISTVPAYFRSTRPVSLRRTSTTP